METAMQVDATLLKHIKGSVYNMQLLWKTKCQACLITFHTVQS